MNVLNATKRLLSAVKTGLLWPVAQVAFLYYRHEVDTINKWYTSQWRWSEEDCNIAFILARLEDIVAMHEEELEDAYERYVNVCRFCNAVPVEPIEGEFK